MATEVGAQDRITIIISGVKGTGGGRATRQVDYDGNLAAFLEAWGEAEVEVKEPDWDAMKKLGKSSASDLQAAMAKLTADLVGTGAKALPQRIVDATCRFLVEEMDFIIADSDPGTDKFYISKGDLVPQVVNVPGDGKSWHITAAAPFG